MTVKDILERFSNKGKKFKEMQEDDRLQNKLQERKLTGEERALNRIYEKRRQEGIKRELNSIYKRQDKDYWKKDIITQKMIFKDNTSLLRQPNIFVKGGVRWVLI